MTASDGTDRGSEGSSRYDSSPVGGLGGEPARTDRDTKVDRSPTPPAGGYSGEVAPSPIDGSSKQEDQPPEGHGQVATSPGGSPESPTESPDESPETPAPETGYATEDSSYNTGGETPTPPAERRATHPCPPSMTCDTRGIDDLECEAKGVKAESDALAAVATALATRRTAFETARAAYTAARDEATQSHKTLEKTVNRLLKETRCMLNRDVARCIDDAFDQVLDCLRNCPDSLGCCVEQSCGFQDRSWTVGQIDDLRVQVEKVEKCFDEVLVKEPAALKERITTMQQTVDDLDKATKADPREDASRLYARAKRARWALNGIWGEFADVNEFQDCLCRGLLCSLRGRQWLAQLAGKKAYQECQETARKRRCDWLRKNIVDETLATQLLLCPPEASSSDESGASSAAGS